MRVSCYTQLSRTSVGRAISPMKGFIMVTTIRKTIYGLAASLIALALLSGCGATLPAQQDDIVSKLNRDSGGR